MTAFDDLLPDETETGIRARIIAYAQAAGLSLTSWLIGSVGQQILEAVIQTTLASTVIIAQSIRGFASLDTSTDPGDADPYDDGNEDLTAAAGFLSFLGSNTYGTTRIGQTFATGTVTFNNAGAGAVSRTFAPYGLTFTWTGGTPPTPASTYRNAESASIYTNPDGTVTVLAGATLDIPIIADEAGATSSAPASTITLTTSLVGASATNAAAVVGTDRESADFYRARCRTAQASASPNGPADAYRFIATSAYYNVADQTVYYVPPGETTGIGIDSGGNLVQIPDAEGVSLGVTRVYVSTASATGVVTTYYATATGAPGNTPSLPGDDTVVAQIKRLLDLVYWPDCTTRFILAAVAEPITVNGSVGGTVYVKAGGGVTAASIVTAINTALTAAFKTFPIGGYDQVSGAGTIYKQELEAIVNGAHPNIYRVVLTSPAGNTALALGKVATLTNSIDATKIVIA